MDDVVLPFDDPPRAIAITAFRIDGEGWEVHLRGRNDFESWARCHRVTYSALQGAELLDVLSSELAGLLGLP